MLRAIYHPYSIGLDAEVSGGGCITYVGCVTNSGMCLQNSAFSVGDRNIPPARFLASRNVQSLQVVRNRTLSLCTNDFLI